MADDLSGIWLKVSNACFDGTKPKVQLEGDRNDAEPAWWPVEETAYEGDHAKNFRAILDGLDRKRTVLVKLTPDQSGLQCSQIRIQHTESRLS